MIRTLPTILIRSMFAITAMTLGLGLVAAVSVVWFGSDRLIRPERRALEPRHHELLASPAEFGLDLEPIPVELPDGVTLETVLATRAASPGRAERTRRMEARLATAGIHPRPSPRGTVVLLHGRDGRKEDMLWVAQRFVAADYRCLVYDARAHGSSGGRYCTFGDKEVADLSTVLDHHEERLRRAGQALGPVCAFGNSLGGAVVLQALTSERRIVAAVAVAPFADLPEIVHRSGRQMVHSHIPGWILDASIRIGGLRAGFDPREVSPIERVAHSETPLFLVHGGRDEVIPPGHTRRLLEASAAGTKIRREIPGGHHHDVLAEGGDDLYQEMIEFCIDQSG